MWIILFLPVSLLPSILCPNPGIHLMFLVLWFMPRPLTGLWFPSWKPLAEVTLWPSISTVRHACFCTIEIVTVTQRIKTVPVTQAFLSLERNTSFMWFCCFFTLGSSSDLNLDSSLVGTSLCLDFSQISTNYSMKPCELYLLVKFLFIWKSSVLSINVFWTSCRN